MATVQDSSTTIAEVPSTHNLVPTTSNDEPNAEEAMQDISMGDQSHTIPESPSQHLKSTAEPLSQEPATKSTEDPLPHEPEQQAPKHSFNQLSDDHMTPNSIEQPAPPESTFHAENTSQTLQPTPDTLPHHKQEESAPSSEQVPPAPHNAQEIHEQPVQNDSIENPQTVPEQPSQSVAEEPAIPSIVELGPTNGPSAVPVQPSYGDVSVGRELEVDIEADRLDLQHHVWRMTLAGALYISPLATPPANVLDVGTGTGIWAIEFAEEHPNSHVLGTDLSPIQPNFVPPNCNFIVDDAESDWVFEKKFDFIHGRMLCMGIHDWSRYFRQCWEHCKPGGWIEVQEICPPMRCDDGSLGPDDAFMKWSDMVVEASAMVGIDTSSPTRFSSYMEEAGFINVREEKAMWAVGPWPKGKREKAIGQWTQENMLQGVHGISVALFTRRLEMSREAVELFLVDVRKDIKNPKAHVYAQMYIHCAQKPPLPERSSGPQYPTA
ncbi:hypothetical protein MMC25_000064 [Agyrium rufum]|nr:hypothetical protein [Agyrium rufum]